ncbi:MAG: DUF4249 domain-containing protein [Bacteroidota bacterium]
MPIQFLINSRSGILFLLVLFMYFLSGCSNINEIDFSGEANVIVVNSQFNPDSLWRISVSRSKIITDPGQVENLRTANVQLYEGELLLEQLSFQGSEPIDGQPDGIKGYFVSNTHQPQVGQAYTVKVSAEGFDSVQATDVLPANTAAIEEFSYLGLIEEDEFSTYRQFRLEFKDLAPEANYYEVALIQQNTRWVIESGDTLFSETWETRPGIYLEGGASGSDLIDDESNGFETVLGQSVIFEDGAFNESNKVLLINSFIGLSEPRPNEGWISDYWIELRSISEAYYRYQRTLMLLDQTQSDPFAEPVSIYNNVEGGLGNFAGYSGFLSERVRVFE